MSGVMVPSSDLYMLCVSIWDVNVMSGVNVKCTIRISTSISIRH